MQYIVIFNMFWRDHTVSGSNFDCFQKMHFNPFVLSVAFCEPRQMVQTQIGHCRQEWKSTADTPQFGKGLIQLIRMEKSTGQIWLNKFLRGNVLKARKSNKIWINRLCFIQSVHEHHPEWKSGLQNLSSIMAFFDERTEMITVTVRVLSRFKFHSDHIWGKFLSCNSHRQSVVFTQLISSDQNEWNKLEGP